MLKKLLSRAKFNDLSKSDYINNADKISESNLEMLTNILHIMAALNILLFILSFFIESLKANSLVYLMGLGIVLVIFVAKKLLFDEYSIWMSYLLFVAYFLLCLKLNIFYKEHMASTLLSALIIIPLVITDYSKRINSFVMGMCVISLISSFWVKESNVALVDATNFICFTIIGIYLGEKQKKIRIHNFNNILSLSNQRYTDQLTNMLNRRKFFQDMLEQANDKNFVGAIMVDIDWFKKLNDTYGHDAGDDCLRKIGRTFVEFGKNNDITFYRYGGEEFVAIGNGCSMSKLRELSNKLLNIVRGLNIPADYSPYEKVTISIGYSEGLISNKEELEDVIRNADKALYRAKATTRNTAIGYNKNKFL